MAERELPDNVRGLISSSVPTLDALELLIGVARRAPAVMSPEMLYRELGSKAIGLGGVRDYCRFLTGQGVIAEDPPGLFGYRPATSDLDDAVQGLLRAYNERPVTLIRTVYDLADQKRIQAFSDAFRFKRGQ